MKDQTTQFVLNFLYRYKLLQRS